MLTAHLEGETVKCVTVCQNVQLKDQTLPYKSTCSAETSMTMDCYLPLLQRKGHDLQYVQHSGKTAHSIVIPAKVVKINCNCKMLLVAQVICKFYEQVLYKALTVIFHEVLWSV